MATTGPLLPVPAGRSSQSPFTVAVVRTHAMLFQATSTCFTLKHAIAVMDTHKRGVRASRGAGSCWPRSTRGHGSLLSFIAFLPSFGRSGLASACDQEGPGRVVQPDGMPGRKPTSRAKSRYQAPPAGSSLAWHNTCENPRESAFSR